MVQRNVAVSGYCFPPATRPEVWREHIAPVAAVGPLNDRRIAELLKVEPGTPVMRRFGVTGPEAEPPFQVSTSWIHPRAANGSGSHSPPAGPDGWQHRLEVGGHWPITWMEIHRARMPSTREAALLEISVGLPVLEIIRVGVSGDDGEPVEVTECVVASDRVETIHLLHRGRSAREPWPEMINARPEDDPQR